MLGQSFGGFTSMTYLSIAPEGLREALITGGLAPIGRPVDDIYAATYRRVIDTNERYFERYPDDRARVRDIHRRLDGEDVRCRSGDRLTARRFRQLGMWLGDSAGWELLHHVIELPFGLAGVPATTSRTAPSVSSRNPIYATLHESSYADGVATRWSADRLLPDEIRDGAALHRRARLPLDVRGLRGRCRPHAGRRRDPRRAPMAARCTTRTGWPSTRSRSRRRSTSTTCTSSGRSPRRRPAAIRGLRPWITNEFEHNGLRADGERVLGRLIDLVRGRA